MVRWGEEGGGCVSRHGFEGDKGEEGTEGGVCVYLCVVASGGCGVVLGRVLSHGAILGIGLTGIVDRLTNTNTGREAASDIVPPEASPSTLLYLSLL